MRLCKILDASIVNSATEQSDAAYDLCAIEGTPKEIADQIQLALATCDLIDGHAAHDLADNGIPLYLDLRIRIARKDGAS